MRLALTMLSNGSRLRDIQAATGLRPASVSVEARTYGVRRGVFSEVRKAVSFVLQAGLSVGEAAKQTGVPAHKIYYALRVQMNSSSLAKPKAAEVARWDEIAEMKGTGATLAEVASFYGVSRQRIHQILKKRTAYLAWVAQQGE